MVRLIFVRHGEKDEQPRPDEELPLREDARQRTAKLRDDLHTRGLVPGICLSSRYEHAYETACILKGSAPVVRVTPLTPHTPEAQFSLEAILAETASQGAPLTGIDVVALIGHEPRLRKLIEAATSGATAGLEYLEAVVLRADSLEQFLAGSAVLEERFVA